MPTAATTTTPIFTAAQYAQLHRYNEITDEFFKHMGSGHVFETLLELYGYMEESNLLDAGSPQANSDIKRDWLLTIQKIGSFIAEAERIHLFFKDK